MTYCDRCGIPLADVDQDDEDGNICEDCMIELSDEVIAEMQAEDRADDTRRGL